MKTLVLCVKDKLPCHKTIPCPVFSIYVEYIYIYMCTYVYHEPVGTRFYLSPIVRFNKAGCFFYNRSPCEFAVPLRLHYHMVSLLCLQIDIYNLRSTINVQDCFRNLQETHAHKNQTKHRQREET